MERHLLENVTAPMASSETSSDSSAIVAKLIAGVVTADGTVNNTALIAALTGLQTAAIANDPFTAYKDGRFGIDSGDTAWMLTSCAFVLLMTIPGLAMFYGGMVQPKNYLHTVMQSFTICCLVTCIWMIFGYSLAFTRGSPVIGSSSRFWMVGMKPLSMHPLAATIPESVFFIFQMTFAIITPALICGGLAERMKFSSLIVFMSAWSLLVYSPVAHSVWYVSSNGFDDKTNGWLTFGRLYRKDMPDGSVFKGGILDFAGGAVVHINSGTAALVSAIVLGKRHGFGKVNLEPHNLSVSLIGASLLWMGWYGFNAGSAVASNFRAGYAMATTQVATGAGGLSWMFVEWFIKGKPTVLSIISGAVAGLVVITPACGFVDMTGAMCMGCIGGIVCLFGVQMKHKIGYDDALDAFGVHGIGGALGAFLLGFFACPDVAYESASDFTGIFYIKRYMQLKAWDDANKPGERLFNGNKHAGGVQLGLQVIGIVVVAAYSGFMTFIFLKVIDLIMGVRVDIATEVEGLDSSVHGEKVYYGGDTSVHEGEKKEETA